MTMQSVEVGVERVLQRTYPLDEVATDLLEIASRIKVCDSHGTRLDKKQALSSLQQSGWIASRSSPTALRNILKVLAVALADEAGLKSLSSRVCSFFALFTTEEDPEEDGTISSLSPANKEIGRLLGIFKESSVSCLFSVLNACSSKVTECARKYLEAQLDSVNPGLKHVVSKSVVTIHLPDEFSIRVKTCDDPTASPLTRRDVGQITLSNSRSRASEENMSKPASFRQTIRLSRENNDFSQSSPDVTRREKTDDAELPPPLPSTAPDPSLRKTMEIRSKQSVQSSQLKEKPVEKRVRATTEYPSSEPLQRRGQFAGRRDKRGTEAAFDRIWHDAENKHVEDTKPHFHSDVDYADKISIVHRWISYGDDSQFRILWRLRVNLLKSSGSLAQVLLEIPDWSCRPTVTVDRKDELAKVIGTLMSLLNPQKGVKPRVPKVNLTRSLSHTALDLALPVSMSEEGKSVDSVCVNSARSVMLEDIEYLANNTPISRDKKQEKAAFRKGMGDNDSFIKRLQNVQLLAGERVQLVCRNVKLKLGAIQTASGKDKKQKKDKKGGVTRGLFKVAGFEQKKKKSLVGDLVLTSYQLIFVPCDLDVGRLHSSTGSKISIQSPHMPKGGKLMKRDGSVKSMPPSNGMKLNTMKQKWRESDRFGSRSVEHEMLSQGDLPSSAASKLSSLSTPSFHNLDGSSPVNKNSLHSDEEERVLFRNNSSDSDSDTRTTSSFEGIKMDTKANVEVGFGLSSQHNLEEASASISASPTSLERNSCQSEIEATVKAKRSSTTHSAISPVVSPRHTRSLAFLYPYDVNPPQRGEEQKKYSIISIPFIQISRMEKLTQMFQKVTGAHQIVQIDCKDFRTIRISFKSSETSCNFFLENMSNLLPRSNGEMFAFRFAALKGNAGSDVGWSIYDERAELKRLGVPNKQWRVTETNVDFELCDTYPRLLGVPATISDDHLQKVKEFRSRGRLPALSWLHPVNGASLTRCSQPRVGLARAHCNEDEMLLADLSCVNKVYWKKGQVHQLMILDARPRANAVANHAIGAGFEDMGRYKDAKMKFLGIPNIHVMRESVRKLHEMCLPDDGSRGYENVTRSYPVLIFRSLDYSALDVSHWMEHISLLMGCASRICSHMMLGVNVLIHCSDGWDRTAQLSSLAMLLLDPYYRTLKGFIVLIEKEWLAFGHKFEDRCGHLYPWNESETSPIFLQFMDCVWQYTQQYPDAFEFSTRLLASILDHLNSGHFGTFLCNSVKEREACGVRSDTISLWTHVLQNCDEFINPLFNENAYGKRTNPSSVLLPCTAIKHLPFWKEYYCRYDPNMYPQTFDGQRSFSMDEVLDYSREVMEASQHQSNQMRAMLRSYAKRDTVSQREVVQMARELEVKGAQVEELEKRLKELEQLLDEADVKRT